jgi:hypothetical protein
MKSKTFDRKFDEGREFVDQLDLTKAHRVGTNPKRVNAANREDIQTKIAEGYASAQRGELLNPNEIRSKLAKLKRSPAGDQ